MKISTTDYSNFAIKKAYHGRKKKKKNNNNIMLVQSAGGNPFEI